jgi:hypothetical protein
MELDDVGVCTLLQRAAPRIREGHPLSIIRGPRQERILTTGVNALALILSKAEYLKKPM